MGRRAVCQREAGQGPQARKTYTESEAGQPGRQPPGRDEDTTQDTQHGRKGPSGRRRAASRLARGGGCHVVGTGCPAVNPPRPVKLRQGCAGAASEWRPSPVQSPEARHPVGEACRGVASTGVQTAPRSGLGWAAVAPRVGAGVLRVGLCFVSLVVPRCVSVCSRWVFAVSRRVLPCLAVSWCIRGVSRRVLACLGVSWCVRGVSWCVSVCLGVSWCVRGLFRCVFSWCVRGLFGVTVSWCVRGVVEGEACRGWLEGVSTSREIRGSDTPSGQRALSHVDGSQTREMALGDGVRLCPRISGGQRWVCLWLCRWVYLLVWLWLRL